MHANFGENGRIVPFPSIGRRVGNDRHLTDCCVISSMLCFDVHDWVAIAAYRSRNLEVYVATRSLSEMSSPSSIVTSAQP